MDGCGALAGWIGVARFHRRLHELADWLDWMLAGLGVTTGDGSSSRASPCQCADRRSHGAQTRIQRGRAPPNARCLLVGGRLTGRPDETPAHAPAFIRDSHRKEDDIGPGLRHQDGE